MVGDYKVCIDEATAFLNVAKSCIDSIGEFLSGKMYPFAVNASFSCELFIKAIMIKQSPTQEFSRGHDLKQPFDALDDKDRTAIRSAYNKKCSKPLDELLDESGKAFEDWRYALEKGVSICVTGIIAFVVCHSLNCIFQCFFYGFWIYK